MYLLPSLFTAGSLGAGYFSVTQTIAALDGSGQAHAHLDWAAIAILFAIPFDALDGRIARLTNTASDFGRELDSLADVITFGMAPSILAFVWGFHFLPDSMNPQLRQHLMQAGAFICFLFLLSGASRLALWSDCRTRSSREAFDSMVKVGSEEVGMKGGRDARGSALSRWRRTMRMPADEVS